MTHADLVIRAERWLRRNAGCGFVLTDKLKANNTEHPDAIGWRNGVSILVECKATRGDFLSDRAKPFRQNPEIGMGGHRYYMCPPDIIRPDDLPEGWRLLWVYPRQVRSIVDAKGNAHWSYPPFAERNRDAEIKMMASALRRLHLCGSLSQIYDQPWRDE